MNVILTGPPGSGKSTQAKLLAEKLGLLRIASGDISRQIACEDTDEGHKVRDLINAGGLTPDDILFRRIRKIYESTDKGLLMDGYPRNGEQIFLVEKMLLEKNQQVDKVVVIDLSEDEGLKRMLLRANEEGRADDVEDTIRARFQIYFTRTQPIITYFEKRGIVVHVDGRPGIEEIHNQIVRVFSS